MMTSSFCHRVTPKCLFGASLKNHVKKLGGKGSVALNLSICGSSFTLTSSWLRSFDKRRRRFEQDAGTISSQPSCAANWTIAASSYQQQFHTEDLVHSCVTPQKVQRVHETRQSETDRYKCAIKLLPNFFTPAELAMSNTDGNFGKQPLDKTKLHTLKGNLYQLSLVRYGHGRLKGTFFVTMGLTSGGRADLIREWWSDLLLRNCVYWFPLFFFFSVDLHNVSSWSRRYAK